MRQQDREAVLYAACYGPVIGVKVFFSYLRMKRAARRAEKAFYRELVRSGVPKIEAQYLAGEYGSSISVRKLVKGAGDAIPALRH